MASDRGPSQWGVNVGSVFSGLGSAISAIGGIAVAGSAAQQQAAAYQASIQAENERQKQQLHTIRTIAIGAGLLILIIVVLIIITRKK